MCQMKCWDCFSPSTVWIPRIELGLAGLAASPFSRRAVSADLSAALCKAFEPGSLVYSPLQMESFPVLCCSAKLSTAKRSWVPVLPGFFSDAWRPRLRAARTRALLFL